MELRTLDFEKDKSFECQGRKFYLRESLSFARYRELQKLNLEFAFSATFHDIFKQIRMAWDKLNEVKLGEAAVILHNIMYGVVSLEDKEDPALRLCALFIDEDGEDPSVYDEAKMKEKIACWAGGNLDTTPFFQLAINLIPHWRQTYLDVSQNGLSATVMENKESQQ